MTRIVTAVLLISGLTPFAETFGQDPLSGTVESPDQESAPLSAAELEEVLAAAAQTQESLKQLAGAFHVRFVVALEALSAEVLDARPNLAWNGGEAEGVLEWQRDGQKRRLTLRMNVPQKFMRQEYEDITFMDDGDMQVHHFLRTNQLSVVSSGTLSCQTPEDWLLPGSGLRKTFDELRRDSSVTLSGQRVGKDAEIVIDVDNGAGEVWKIRCHLASDLGYAITRWESQQGEITEFVDLDYTPGKGGSLTPTSAVKRAVRNDGVEIVNRTLTLDRLLSDEWSGFEFKPGMTFTDNRIMTDGRAALIRVDERGGFQRLNAPAPLRQSQGGLLAGVGGASLLVVAVILRHLRRSSRPAVIAS